MNRRYDLDWIKVIATLLVILYHCSMFFNPWPWHVKNNEIESGAILGLSLVIGPVIMPLFFIVSGISLSSALQKRSSTIFLKERFVRLGIPLLFGVWILSPPQVYIERLANGQFSGSFLSFLPHYTDGLYLDIGGSGNFSFVGHHLWYLFVLLIFSVVLLPLLLKTKSTVILLKPFYLLLLPVPLFLLKLVNPTVQLGGYDLLFYLLIMLYGFYFLRDSQLLVLLKQHTALLFATAALSCGLWITGFLQEWNSVLLAAIQVVYCWCSILLIFHLAARHLSFTSSRHRYLIESSMPYYVLHQPIIVITGFLIKDWHMASEVKFLLLAIFTYAVVVAFYHFAVRPYAVPRLLTGLKAHQQKGKHGSNETAAFT